MNLKGQKIGFLSYVSGLFINPKNLSINKLEEKEILNEIKNIKNQCNFIVVSLHWGIENVSYPSPKQINLAHKIIDGGANLILGHHPHIVQGLEEYNNGLIVYSLGNFQFIPALSKSESNNSFILKIELTRNKILKHEIIPIKIDKTFKPVILQNPKKIIFLDHISKISSEIININNNCWFKLIADKYLKESFYSYKFRIKKYGIVHFFEFLVWIFTPFNINCYLALIRIKIRKRR